MRQNQQQNKQRMRGRSRKGPNPLTRSYESNGPDVKIRGTALHVAEKYTQLARDASSSGDRVMAENYLQHAEHYYRIIAAAQAALQPQFGREDLVDEGDDDLDLPGNDRFEPRQIDFRPNGGQPENGRNGGDRDGGYQPREGQQAGGDREGGYQQRDNRGNREGGYQQRDNRGGDREGGYQPRENRGEREGGYQQRDNRGGDREGGYQQRENRGGDREGGYQQRERFPNRNREGFQPRPEGEAAAPQQVEGGEAREPRRNRRDRFERRERFDRNGRPAQPEVSAEAPTAPGGGPMPLDAPQPDVSFPDFITRPVVTPPAATPAPAPAPVPAPAVVAAPEPARAEAPAGEAAGEEGDGKKRAPRTRRTATTTGPRGRAARRLPPTKGRLCPNRWTAPASDRRPRSSECKKPRRDARGGAFSWGGGHGLLTFT